MAELCKEFELHPTQINEWKRQFLERAADVFGAGTTPGPVDLAPSTRPELPDCVGRFVASADRRHGHTWTPPVCKAILRF